VLDAGMEQEDLAHCQPLAPAIALGHEIVGEWPVRATREAVLPRRSAPMIATAARLPGSPAQSSGAAPGEKGVTRRPAWPKGAASIQRDSKRKRVQIHETQ
jgi:hypothetical protein